MKKDKLIAVVAGLISGLVMGIMIGLPVFGAVMGALGIMFMQGAARLDSETE
jgi:hypothetical protein